MTWHTSGDVDAFLHAAGDFLRADPVANTLPLSLANTLRVRGPHAYGPGDPIFGWWTGAAGRVDGAFLQTPPFPLLLTALPPEAVPAAAEALAGRDLPAVNALTADAEAFAAGWPAVATPGMRTRLFRLGRLTPPAPAAPGSARHAIPSDLGLLVSWFEAYQLDVYGRVVEGPDKINDLVSYGGLTLWVYGDEPVSMAATTRPHSGLVRVFNVYTPPGLRGRGYAGAATTAATEAALTAGARDVCLMTDLANPTSNALYQRLGFQPVEDRVVMEFS